MNIGTLKHWILCDVVGASDVISDSDYSQWNFVFCLSVIGKCCMHNMIVLQIQFTAERFSSRFFFWWPRPHLASTTFGFCIEYANDFWSVSSRETYHHELINQLFMLSRWSHVEIHVVDKYRPIPSSSIRITSSNVGWFQNKCLCIHMDWGLAFSPRYTHRKDHPHATSRREAWMTLRSATPRATTII